MSAKSQASACFRAEVVGDGAECFFCGEWKPPGELDACHLVPKVRLQAHASTLPEEEKWAMVYDPDLAVPGCGQWSESGCHHRSHHAPRGCYRIVYYEELPPKALEAAERHQILWSLERDYPSLEELRGVV